MPKTSARNSKARNTDTPQQLRLLARLVRAMEEELGRATLEAMSDEEWHATYQRYAAAQGATLLEQQLDDAALAEIKAILQATLPAIPAATAPPASTIPPVVGQQTFMEARNMAIAIADGASQRRWDEVLGETALYHAIPGENVQVKLTAKPTLNWWDAPATMEGLWDEVRKFEPAAVLLLHVALGWGLQEERVHTSIDDLIRLIGWKPRERAEREEQRRKVWRWLLLFDAMPIIGKRPGKYKDPHTNQLLDMSTTDSLIKIITRYDDDPQPNLDGSDVPRAVTWVVGDWLAQFRGNERVLQYFGDVRKVAAIPAGKPSGAWAQSIAMALNQVWREQASRAEVDHVGEENNLTVKFRPFTRLQLLDMFRCEPWVEDVLNSNDPKRAQKYWQEAIRILRHEAGIIGHYAELDPIPETRKAWQAFWLKHQRLDIRPKSDGIEATAGISRKAARVRRRARPTTPSKKNPEE